MTIFYVTHGLMTSKMANILNMQNAGKKAIFMFYKGDHFILLNILIGMLKMVRLYLQKIIRTLR